MRCNAEGDLGLSGVLNGFDHGGRNADQSGKKIGLFEHISILPAPIVPFLGGGAKLSHHLLVPFGASFNRLRR